MSTSRIIYTAVFAVFACLLFALPGHSQDTETFCSTDVPVIIDDGPANTVTSNLVIPVGGGIQNVVVSMQIDHTWQNDLVVRLESPESTSVLLFGNVDGADNNFGTTCFPSPNFILDDDAVTPVGSIDTSDPTGAFIPEQPLSLFDGEVQDGLWTLTIDDQFGADGGALNCWCLTITSGFVVSSVPTMNEWAMMAFAVMLGAAGAFFIYLRRRQAVV